MADLYDNTPSMVTTDLGIGLEVGSMESISGCTGTYNAPVIKITMGSSPPYWTKTVKWKIWDNGASAFRETPMFEIGI